MDTILTAGYGARATMMRNDKSQKPGTRSVPLQQAFVHNNLKDQYLDES